MATNAVVSWTANTESDLSGYTLYWSLYPGSFTGYPLATGAIPTTTTSYIIDSTLSFLPSDGLWYFTVEAFDTSNNRSPKATAVSKRIIRTASKLIVRR